MNKKKKSKEMEKEKLYKELETLKKLNDVKKHLKKHVSYKLFKK